MSTSSSCVLVSVEPSGHQQGIRQKRPQAPSHPTAPEEKKKQRVSSEYLSGVKVWFVMNSIPHSRVTVPIWTRKLLAAGGQVAQARPRGGGEECEPVVVSSAWILQCFSEKRLVDPEPYTPAAHSGADSAAEEEEPARGRVRRFRDWMGFWEPAFDSIETQTELVLQAAFSEENEKRRGNEAVYSALRELAKYEDALEGDFMRTPADEVDKAEPAKLVVNSRSLKYARAAAVVRACAFNLKDWVLGGKCLPPLPFVGEALARQINDLAKTGTTRQLEEHRANAQVFDSKMLLRPGAVGGKARYLFKQLPGVGAATAEQWFKKGFTTLEDLEQVAEDGRLAMRQQQRFSLQHRASLLSPCPEADVAEMGASVHDALVHVTSGAEWEIVRVGGAARSTASHDADFVLYPKDERMCMVDGCAGRLATELISRQQLVGPSEAMCQVQEGKLATHLDEMRRHDIAMVVGNLSADRYDRIFGNFRTLGGAVRRIDVIISPPEEAAFCILGWTGTRQYLRFLRQHAVDCGMRLNSHRLMRADPSTGQGLIIPDEAPPLDRQKRPYWPPGWGPDRRVKTERDIFELMGVKYLEPFERNA